MHKGVAKQIFLESGVDTPGGGTIYKNSEDQSYQSLGLTLPVLLNLAQVVPVSEFIL